MSLMLTIIKSYLYIYYIKFHTTDVHDPVEVGRSRTCLLSPGDELRYSQANVARKTREKFELTLKCSGAPNVVR